jgi:hypothetical protein
VNIAGKTDLHDSGLWDRALQTSLDLKHLHSFKGRNRNLIINTHIVRRENKARE